MTEPLLRLCEVAKRYGGLVVTDNVSLEIAEGEVHGLIGPNGAGKTTLISQISGEINPDAGRILLRGRPLAHLGTAARTRLGVARTFQIVQLLDDSTALDNVAIAVAARRRSYDIWNRAGGAEIDREARRYLELAAIGDRGGVLAANLAHGEQKQLELAVALATEPELLLLDEPLAGLGIAESQRMIEILGALKGQLTMLLVEHDLDAVYALAGRISVLVNGRLIASGTADEIRVNHEVRSAYLGEDQP
jgi:branched-chain amino acid transport system ATP-binding protein